MLGAGRGEGDLFQSPNADRLAGAQPAAAFLLAHAHAPAAAAAGLAGWLAPQVLSHMEARLSAAGVRFRTVIGPTSEYGGEERGVG